MAIRAQWIQVHPDGERPYYWEIYSNAVRWVKPEGSRVVWEGHIRKDGTQTYRSSITGLVRDRLPNPEEDPAAWGLQLELMAPEPAAIEDSPRTPEPRRRPRSESLQRPAEPEPEQRRREPAAVVQQRAAAPEPELRWDEPAVQQRGAPPERPRRAEEAQPERCRPERQPEQRRCGPAGQLQRAAGAAGRWEEEEADVDATWRMRVRLLVKEAKIGLPLQSLGQAWEAKWPDDPIEKYRPCKKLKEAIKKYVGNIYMNPSDDMYLLTRVDDEPLLRIGRREQLEQAIAHARRVEELRKDGRASIQDNFLNTQWQSWATSYTQVDVPEGSDMRMLFRCTVTCDLPPTSGRSGGAASASASSPLAQTWAYEIAAADGDRLRNEFNIVEEDGQLVYQERANPVEPLSTGVLHPDAERLWWQALVVPERVDVRVRWEPAGHGGQATLEVQCKQPGAEWDPTSMVARHSTSGTYIGYGEGPHRAAVAAMEAALKDPRLPPPPPPPPKAAGRAAPAPAPEIQAPPPDARALSALAGQKASLSALLRFVHGERLALVEQAPPSDRIYYPHGPHGQADADAVAKADAQFSADFPQLVDGVCALLQGRCCAAAAAAGADDGGGGAAVRLRLTDPVWVEDRILSIVWQYCLASGDVASMRCMAGALLQSCRDVREELASSSPASSALGPRPEAVGLSFFVWEELAERAARLASSAWKETAEQALRLLDRSLTAQTHRYATHFLKLLYFERVDELRAGTREALVDLDRPGGFNSMVFRGSWSRSDQQRPDIDLQLHDPGTRSKPLRKGDLVLLVPYPAGDPDGALLEVRADYLEGARGESSGEASTLKLKVFGVALPWRPPYEQLYRSSQFLVLPLKSTRVTHDRQVDAVKAFAALSKESKYIDPEIRELVTLSWKEPGDAGDEAADGELLERVRALARAAPKDHAGGPAACAAAAGGVRCSVPLTAAQGCALAGASARRCMLIRGPPGTGKTHTACAIVEQWLGEASAHSGRNKPRVLVVTQSNAAALNIQERLQQFSIQCVRVGMQMRPEELLCQTFFLQLFSAEELRPLRAALASSLAGFEDSEHRAAVLPMLQRAARQSPVVVMTCISSGNMSLLGGCNFSRILLDEAAQATEPTALVPLMTGATAFACVGDDKQLPATVTSRDAEAGGLGISLFERFVQRGGRCAGVVTPGDGFVQLDVQRRMHSSISAFPSQRFYGGELRDGVPDEERPAVAGLPWPGSGKCRVLVVDVSPPRWVPGNEEAIGTSVRNTAEAQLLVDVMAHAVDRNRAGQEGLQVAAITGYSAQKAELKRLISQNRGLRSQGPERFRVDTVDGFQGMERDLVLVSAVRSNASGEAGFLRDERRANVLLTRARRGLVVFCDTRTLRLEAGVWAPWLRWAEEHDAIMSVEDLRWHLSQPRQ